MAADLNKTLQQLDGQNFGKSSDESHLVTTIRQLRDKPLKDFSVENLRMVIGQNLSLDVLIPLALERLKVDILSEGDFYPGDLLKAVLDCDARYWTSHREQWVTFIDLYSLHKSLFESDDAYRQIRRSFELFEKI